MTNSNTQLCPHFSATFVTNGARSSRNFLYTSSIYYALWKYYTIILFVFQFSISMLALHFKKNDRSPVFKFYRFVLAFKFFFHRLSSILINKGCISCPLVSTATTPGHYASCNTQTVPPYPHTHFKQQMHHLERMIHQPNQTISYRNIF